MMHKWIDVALCFAVASKVYGEDVGCALVLSSTAPADVQKEDIIAKLEG